MDLLEIGAAGAFFSRLFKERYPGTANLSVVEAGDGWEPYYRALDISLVATFFPFKSTRRFHYIHASHWFEHVSNLEDALQKIRTLLIPHGLLFIEVPNCDDEYYSLDFGDLPHVHFFTKGSLSALVEQHGFTTLTIDEYGLTAGEEWKRRTNPINLDEKILEEGRTSITENIPRRGGDCVRALFEFTG